MHDVIDTVDIEILMHRDAHFGGSFEIMLEYYEQDGVGVMPDFDIEQIEHLQKIEIDHKQNLAETYLPDAAKDSVEESKRIYHQLREVYDQKGEKLISDLILSEEHLPEKEIQALVNQGKDSGTPPYTYTRTF